MPPGGLPETFLEGGVGFARRASSPASPRGAGRSRPPRRTITSGSTSSRCCGSSSGRNGSSAASSAPAVPSASGATSDVLRRLRRASLAALRKEVEPAEQATFGRFLPSWHGIDRRASLREALVPLQGARAAGLALGVRGAAAARPELPGRPSSTSCARAASSSGSARVSTASPSTSARTHRFWAGRRRPSRPEGETHDRLREVLARGAEFWFDLLAAAELEAEQALPALWDLVWAGEVTNDAWTPLRAGRRYGVPRPERRPRRFSRRRSTGITATQGRWSLADRLFEHVQVPGTGTGPDRRALAELLLERQGIVTRDGVRAEGIVGGYSAVYGELKALETLGLCGAGYFVEGLGGAQFALGGAVERLRELRPKEGEEPEPLVIAAADPAQPYGAGAALAEACGWPGGPRRRRARRPPRRRGGALRRARRTLDRHAPRARRRVAATRTRGPRRAREDEARAAPRGRALRRRAGGRHRADAAAARGRVPRRPPPSRPSALAKPPEDEPEDGVPDRRLREGARALSKSGTPRRRARGGSDRRTCPVEKSVMCSTSASSSARRRGSRETRRATS